VEFCPCFIGRSGDNEASLAGTRCHEAVESGNADTLDDEQAMAVAKVISYRDSVTAEFESRFKGTCRRLSEFEVAIDDIPQGVNYPDGRPVIGTTGGFFDYGIVSPDRDAAVLMDWKFVQWEVEPVETNLQFLVYACGLKNAYPEIKTVEVHCVCPYLNFIDVHTFTEEDLARALVRIHAVVARKKEAHPEQARPSFPSCTFCANLGKCQAVADIVLHVSKKYDPIRVPEDIRPMFVGELDSKNRRDVMILATICSSWAEAARQQVNEVAVADGQEVDGFTLVRTQDRKIVDKEKFKEVALNYIPIERWSECYDVYVSKVEGVIKEVAPRGEKTPTVKQFGQELENEGIVEPGAERAYLRQKKQTHRDE
jgi:hypothetical protein